ncbi:hypothetical protein [Actinoallomurus acanthiterrae]
MIAYVISGTINCHEAVRVFNTLISMPDGQIPGEPVTFNGWTCTFAPPGSNDRARKATIDDGRKGESGLQLASLRFKREPAQTMASPTDRWKSRASVQTP